MGSIHYNKHFVKYYGIFLKFNLDRHDKVSVFFEAKLRLKKKAYIIEF